MKLFDMIKVFRQTKGIKDKRESNYYDLINSNEIRLYKEWHKRNRGMQSVLKRQNAKHHNVILDIKMGE